LHAVQSTAPDLMPFYTVEGRKPQRCDELPLRGYRDSRPVRYGNSARSQLQLGSWGDLLETADLYIEHGNAFDDATADLLTGCVDRVCTLWQDEDSGIWELDDHHHYTVSKLGVWMALDRAVRLVEMGQLPGTHAERWREERRRVQQFVEEQCWSEELGAYAEFAGADSLDAAVLRGARMKWIDVSRERFARTLDAVREQLDAGGGLLYRTSREAGNEGAFLTCSFWAVDACARLGRVDEASELFEQLLGYANDVGLLAEEIDPSSHELLGNFPQGLSHLALINAAGAIQAARDAAPSATRGGGGC
jgi:GH15 family glucan-1,4-alpha-glucosidase